MQGLPPLDRTCPISLLALVRTSLIPMLHPLLNRGTAVPSRFLEPGEQTMRLLLFRVVELEVVAEVVAELVEEASVEELL